MEINPEPGISGPRYKKGRIIWSDPRTLADVQVLQESYGCELPTIAVLFGIGPTIPRQQLNEHKSKLESIPPDVREAVEAKWQSDACQKAIQEAKESEQRRQENSKKDKFWKGERLDRLVALMREGQSASQIGRTLSTEWGMKISANAVVGAIHREGGREALLTDTIDQTSTPAATVTAPTSSHPLRALALRVNTSGAPLDVLAARDRYLPNTSIRERQRQEEKGWAHSVHTEDNPDRSTTASPAR